MLLELELVRGDGLSVAVVDDEPGACGALVDGRHVHLLPFPRHDPSRQHRDRPWRKGAATNEVGKGGLEMPRWGQTNRWQLSGSRAPERRREGEFIGDDGWIRLGRRRTGRGRVGGEVNGRRAVYTSLLLPIRSALLALGSAPGPCLLGRDGIPGVRAKKAGIFFYPSPAVIISPRRQIVQRAIT